MLDYLFLIVGQACILSAIAISVNLLAGYCGLVSLSQMSFCAIGAYAAALIATAYGYPMAVGAAVVVAIAFAWGQSRATANLRGDEFAIATFAIQAAFWLILLNWTSLTRGPLGVTDIPSISMGSFAVDSPARFALVAVAFVGLVQLGLWWLKGGRIGMLMRLIKDDEGLAANFGRNTVGVRHLIWIVAALVSAIAGILQASYVGYVNPASFSTLESTMLLAVVLVGGLGTFWGPVIGAGVMTLVPEGLRFVGLPTAEAANLRQMLLGTILIALIIKRVLRKPQGIRRAGGTL